MDESKLLLSLQDTESLLAPLGQTKKIKYTCVGASQFYIALGANTGGVYCFHRNSFKYIRILANKEGSVSHVSFSPTENCLAVCSGGGYVGLWELNLQEQGVSKRFHVSSLLRDSAVRAMVWDSKGSRLFYGDELGRVGVAYLPKQKIFKKPDEIIFQDKSPVVQMDYHQDLLLISTYTRCLLLKLPTKEYIQVGKKPRDGKFGACFHVRWPDRPPVVSSARPGGRLWEADIEGTVVSTLKLKDLIENGPSATPLLGIGLHPEFLSPAPFQLTTPLNLHYLYVLRNSFLIGWIGSTLFVFNPASYKLTACSQDFENIADLYCDGRQLFVLSEGGRSVRVVSFVEVGVCVCELVDLQLLDQALKVMERFADEVCALLPNDKRLYDAVSMAITFGKSMSVPMSQDLKEKFEVDTQKNCLEQKIKEDIELDGVTTTHSVEKTDGLETVDLDAYTDHVDHDIETGDTVDASLREHDLLTQEFNNADEQTPSDDTVHQAVDAIDHNEPDLDTTLIADEIGEHSETDTNPLASSSQTSLVDANTDTNTPLINGDDVNQFKIDSSPNSSQIQESSNSNVTEMNSFPETSPAVELLHIVRSKSKAIPHQSNSETTASHSDVRMGPNSWTPDSATNSLISDSSSLPKLSLEEIPTLDQQSSSLDKQVHPEMASSQGSDTSHSFKRSFSQTVDKPVNPESMKPLPLARRGSMPDFANRVQMVDFKHSVSLDDDVIAVRVSSNSGTKNKSRKKSRRKKTSSPVSSVGKGATLETGEATPPNTTPSPSHASYLGHIPEETLPFPEVGLPSHFTLPSSQQSSAPTSKSVSPYPSLPSTPPKAHLVTAETTRGFNASMLFNKVKNLTTQLTEKVDVPQPQKQMKMAVKDLLSSLTGQQAVSHDFSGRSHDQAMTVSSVNQHVFYNSDYVTEDGEMEIAEFALSSPSASDQSDGRISAPMSPPPPLSMASTVPPEVTAFVEVTMATNEQLNDPLLITSLERTQDKLQQWLNKLEMFARHLAITCHTHSPTHHFTPLSDHNTSEAETSPISAVFMTSLYQSIDPSTRSTTTELATLCAELNVYSKKTADKLMATSEEDHRDDDRPMETTSSCLNLEAFLSLYWPLLDTQRVRGLINRAPWSTRLAAWKILMNIGGVGQLSELNEASLLKKLTSEELGLHLPAFMQCLFKTSPELLVNVCVKSYPHIQPFEVAMVCGIDQSDSGTQSHDSHTDQSSAYVNYLDTLLGSSNETRQRVLESFTFDPDLLLVSMETLFLSQDTSQVQSQQSRQLVDWIHSKILEALIDVAVAMETKEYQEKARTLCHQYKYWMGVVKLSVAMRDRRKAIQVLLQLRNMKLLEDMQTTGHLFTKLEDFHLLLDLMSRQEVHISTDSQSSGVTSQDRTNSDVATPRTAGDGPQSVCWNGVLQLVMKTVSLPLFNELISSCHGDTIDKQAREQLHWRLVQLTSLHTQQRAVAHTLLEKIDRYLWSQRPTAVSPQVVVVKNIKKEQSSQNPSSQDTPSLLLSSTLPLSPPTIEDAGSHWGIRTQLNGSVCVMCRLPLIETISDLHPGLIVLHCGHAYHKLCLSEQACLTCFTSKQRNC